MSADQKPAQSASQIRLKVGARVYASDPYWPYSGRPVQKERVVTDAVEVAELFAGHMAGPFWTWLDPNNERRRWCRLGDAERV